MYAVINQLTLKPDTDWPALTDKVDRFAASISDPHYVGVGLIRTGDNEAVVLVLFADRTRLDEISRAVAAPWFAENVRQYLAAPAARSIGEVVAGTLKSAS